MSTGLLSIISSLMAAVSAVANASALQFAVQGVCENCPGAESTLVAAAWANIAYMTHSALLYYINFTGFGAWAAMLYAIAAIGALVAVAINSPPRNYTWFILGPAIYGFLVGATQDVQGVDWVVAGEPQDMREVWRDAETGMRNSPLLQIEDARYSQIDVDKVNGPSAEYPVAMPMLFLDELFSATSNLLVKWTGLYNQLGEGGADSNLARAQNLAGNAGGGAGRVGEGPWYLMSTLKAPMVENIVSAHIRNPQLRDALVTFLASECGEALKAGVNSGSYNAASMARGSVIPMTVMIDPIDGRNDFSQGSALTMSNYNESRFTLNATEMPTPRSLLRFLGEPSDVPGSFGKFSPAFSSSNGGASPMKKLYSEQVNCSAYLWTLIQGMRHEMGHAYWQLIRSAPRGFQSQEQVLFTLFYGWDIRRDGNGEYAGEDEITWFTQNLIFTYLLKNELMFAPQITSTEQKFAPSEKTIGYTQAYVGSIGAVTKSSELYNWAVMMPHIQGILLYVIIVGYPFAAMAMIMPGHWKGFFTWVTFFAWIKLWDVGFAVVQVLERSVWAMMGNHSNMARVANMLIQTAARTQGVSVRCGGGDNGLDVMDECAVPDVTSGDGTFDGPTTGGSDQQEAEAFFYFDKALLLGAALDLDISNGYYLYIMAALYFAVPAVTGQLVLGAKAGLGGLLTNALSDGARDISGAAKSGIQGEKTNQIVTNRESLNQAALGKALRSPANSFLQSLDTSNRALDKGRLGAQLGGIDKALGQAASAADLRSKSFGSASDIVRGGFNLAGQMLPDGKGNEKDGKGKGFGGHAAGFLRGFARGGDYAMRITGNEMAQTAYGASARSAARSADLSWDSAAAGQSQTGLNSYARSLSDMASFEAETAAWEAKNSFASNAGMAGVYGVNAGSLAPGAKPSDRMGMALTGSLGSQARDAAHYSGNSFLDQVGAMRTQGRMNYGSSYVSSFWQGGFTPTATMAETARTSAVKGKETGAFLFKSTSSALQQGIAVLDQAARNTVDENAGFLMHPAQPKKP